MRVPVRLPIQVVQAGRGVRRAVGQARRPRRRLGAYGGDVRTEDPLSLVYQGNLGQWEGEWGTPAVEQTYEIYAEPAPTQITYSDVLRSAEPGGAYSPPYQPPPVSYADILPAVWPTQATPVYQWPTPSVATPPIVPASDPSSSWWQTFASVLPAITGAGVSIARAVTGEGGTAPTSYVIPATATAPAQRVVYNPATGQVTTAPVNTAGLVYNPATGQYTPAPSLLPSFLQAAPGAAWYQNPLLLLGGGLVAILFVVMAARR